MAPKVAGILNKVANLQAIDQDEYNELSGFVQKYPMTAPLVDRLVQQGGEALSPDEHYIIKQSLEGSVSSRDAQQAMARGELEETASRGVGIGTKLKDLVASFGVDAAGVPEAIQRGIGFTADYLARQAPPSLEMADPMAAAEYRQQQEKNIPKDFRQQVEAAVPLASIAETDVLRTMYEGMKSPELKARQQLSQERADQAYQGKGGGVSGALAEAGSKAKDILTDPALAANLAVGTLPMAGTAMAAGVLGAPAAIATGGILQGADIGGGVYDELMKAPDGTWDAMPEFASRLSSGESRQEIKQDIASKQARQAFATSALASIALNSTGMGSLSERALSTTAKKAASTSAIRAVVSGAGKVGGEGFTEVGEEIVGKFEGNRAKNPVTGQDLFQGVGTAAVEAMAGSVLGPSLVAGPTEAFAERANAIKETRTMGSATSSTGQTMATDAPTPPTAQPLAATAPTSVAQAEASGVMPVSAADAEAAKMAEPSPATTELQNAHRSAKEADIDMQFEDFLAKTPEAAEEAAAWRQKNPLRDADLFESHWEQVKLGTISATAAKSPKVQEAEAKAEQTKTVADQVTEIVQTGNVMAPPPAGVTVQEMQAAHQDGGEAMRQKAGAAQENARTVQQTVEKEIEQQQPQGEDLAKQVKARRAEGTKELTTYIEAVNAGAVSMDPAKFMEYGVKAGLSQDAITMKIATIQQKAMEKASEAAAEPGFTPTPGGERKTEDARLTELSPTVAPEAVAMAQDVQTKVAAEERIDRELPGAMKQERFGDNNKIVSRDAAEAAKQRIRQKMQAQRSTLNSMPGMDPDLLKDGIVLTGFYLEAGIRRFADVSARLAEDFGTSVRELRPYLRAWYNGARDMMEDNGVNVQGMDSADQVALELKSMIDATPVATPASGKATPLVESIMATGRLPENNNQLKAMLAEIDGKTPDILRMKEGQEAVEVVIALTARATIKASRESGASLLETFVPLRDLYLSQPLLNIRTSTSLENQAYSTPAPLAFLAGELAGLGNGSFYEPTAGNGMLAIGAETNNAWVNELDPQRFERLHAFGFAHLRNGDALGAMDSGFILPRSVDSVIANPPFGSYKVDGKSATAEFDGYHLGKIDHIIAAEALQAMKDGGKASLIIGGIKYLDQPSRKKVYHGTTAQFDSFSESGLGPHFTTNKEVARKFGNAENGRVIEATIDIKNPVRVTDFGGSHNNAAGVAKGLENDGVLPPGYVGDAFYERLMKGVDSPNEEARQRVYDENNARELSRIKDVLKSKGYDGIVYDNKMEGGGDSYIVFSNAQINKAQSDSAGISNLDKIFMSWLHRRYNVVDVFQADGKLYERQGAAWPVRVITIEGRGKSSRKPNDPVPELKTWEEVYAHAATILDARAAGKRNLDALGDIPNQPQDRPPRDSVSPRERVRSTDRADKGTGNVPGDVREGNPEPGLGSTDREPGNADGPSESPVVDAELPVDGSDATSGGTSGPDGEPIAPDGARSSVDVAVDIEAITQPYTPKPYLTELDQGVFVPTNLKQGMEIGEAWLRENVGDVEAFLQQELGYKSDELRSALMGLQAESVAGTIYNMKNGKATIIADDTGIGKARQGYMMMRWAIKNGKIPVFLTADAMLFSDMYQEAIECGDNGLLKPYLVNADANIEILNGDVVERPFRASPSATRGKELQSIADTGRLPASTNALFLTYAQLQVANVQRQALRAIAPNGILVMDEAHLASGEESARGAFFRSLMPEFSGAGYFSATWAKRAGNMSLYTKSAIGDLGMKTEELSGAIERGGLPLQSIIASSMAKNSQFYRRERSFEGVDYRTVMYGQTKEDGTRELSGAMPPEEHVRIHDAVTSCFRSIIDADNAFSQWFEDELKPQLMAQGVLEAGKSTTEALISRSPFTSVVHNGVKLLSLALKTDWVADSAIEALKRGEAPVIALENTMGSFLTDYVSSRQIKVGDPIENFGWGDVLKRYLDRTRYYNAKAETGEKMSGEMGAMNDAGEFELTEPEGKKKKQGKTAANRVTVSLDIVPLEVKALYMAAERKIEQLNISAPASPIDWVRYRINKAGYSVEEISGVSRGLRINYADKVPTLSMETSGKRERKKTLRDFNRRKIDVLLLTNAGSVGISAHCDRRWSDPNNPNRRHMIVWQAAQDVNVFKQILGRVHRTGQLVPPRYSIMALDLPSERRPIARLQKKFKSLNASTSSNTKGNMDVEGVDLLNRYGDQVVAGFLAERPDMAAWLGVALDDSNAKDMLIGLAETATGHLAILPVKSQLEFYDAVIPAYMAHIDNLTRTGQNKLLKRTFDYRAEEVQRKVIYPGTGIPGPFSDPAWIVDFKVRQTAMNLKPESVKEEIDGNLNGMEPGVHRSEMLNSAAQDWKVFEAAATDEVMEKARESKRKTAQGVPEIGSQWIMEMMGDKVTGVVTRIRRTGEGKLGNPYAPSKWYVRMATNGSFGHLELALTAFLKEANPVFGLGLEEVFAEDASPMVTRKIVMGNIFGAYTQLEKDGEIVEFTTADGKLNTGMLLPKLFNAETDLKQDIRIQGGAMITGIMEKMKGTIDPFMVPEDGGALISIRDGMATIELDSSARANVLKWTALTGLEFANGSARVKVGEESTKAFERLPVRVGRDVLTDIGVLKEGVVDPKAIMDPNELMDITPEFMDLCCESLKRERFPVDPEYMRRIVGDLKRAGAVISADQMRIESIVEQIRNGRPVELSRLTSFVRGMFGRRIKDPDHKKQAGEKAREGARKILDKSRMVASVIARASGAERIKAKRTPTGMQSYQIDSAFGSAIRRLYPFIPTGWQGVNEIMAYTEYTLFCYNLKHPEDQIHDLSSDDAQKKFNEYLDGGVKAMAHPMASMAALGIGLMASGMVYNVGMHIAPEFMWATLGGVAMVATLKALKLVLRGVHRHYIPTGQILGAMANGENQQIVDMMNHLFLLAQPLKANGDIFLERAKTIIARKAVESVSPGASSIREKIEASVWTSKEVQAKMDQYARDIANFLEGKAELPDEIKSAEDAILKQRQFWADEASKHGMSLLDNYFPRMYDFDGLQALKQDSKALGRLVKELAAQVIENDEERVIEAMEENHMGSMQEAAEAVTMAVLQGMYDGSEDAKRGIAKARDASLASFVEKMLVDTGREAQRGAIYAIMNRMRKQVGPYTAGSMKRRTIPFQLPETWLGSDGAMLHLVDRDYFRVMGRYNANMSRAVAQRMGLLKGQVNRFLNSISNKKQHDEVETAIRNELWNRYHVDAEILNVNERDGKLATWTKENTRKAMTWHRNYNSVTKLGLTPVFWMRNLLFGLPKAMAFLDIKSVFKGGSSGRYGITGLRGSDKWYKDQYERARVAGGIMEGVLESSIGNDKKTWRALMVGGRRSQQIVDVMGFYGGIAQMQEVVDAAKKGDPLAISDLRTALGEKGAMAIMDRATGSVTTEEEDLFGLHYRMLLSGSGRGFNLPSFMSHEVFQWIMQFKRIPMEDTFLWATRVKGPKAEAKYWGGAMVAGMAATGIAMGMKTLAMALLGDQDDDEEEKQVSLFEKWGIGTIKSSGALQLTEPFVAMPLIAAGYLSDDPMATTDRIANQLSGGSMTLAQIARAPFTINTIRKQVEKADSPLDVPGTMVRATFGAFLSGYPIVNQMGLRDEVKELEKGE